MARTPSTMLALGTTAPDFNLLNPVTGTHVSLSELAGGKGVVVLFICNHCPYVKLIADAVAIFANEYQAQGIRVVAINSNDADNYLADSPGKMVEEAQRRGYNFPYLYDVDQSVAKAYHAACTPDLFLFDDEMKLFYRGQFDASRPSNEVETTGCDLRAAVDALIAGNVAPTEQLPSLGCNIKWKPGNAPDYF
ncbi:thioredoxin family protein [Solemya pervernicosa gill symbiont]|uniref:Thioredoxin family protein n=2 Tax=Gammaproteobacteria incertae sedis TaxID=118884 RepID=A0A1T2L2N4_9GAMM|nr:thioredoxin family protein [Candidatus Reidiella endopervernicosa]OOZ39357.1 thioredoxin family protein [Solemya pervernicosa gill symbiont]QKQ26506.1 thioredoxin family protein [Candidatus Reidiella endopervernicosa]